MQSADFQPNAPGNIVKTTFEDVFPSGTRVQIEGTAFVPHPLPPHAEIREWRGELFDIHDDLKTSLLRLDAEINLLPGKTLLLSAMQTREAQASSRIENTFASVREIALAALGTPHVPEQSREVFRNRQAIMAALESPLPVSGRLLKEMHSTLIVDPRHTPGQYRTKQVCIGDASLGFRGARFVPPPGVSVPACMGDWEIRCHAGDGKAPEWDQYPYFVRLALLHYQFEAIHPFSDGNGRLGRALVTVAPVKDGQLQHPVCNLSEWVQANRQQYYDRLLRVSTHGEWLPWVRFFFVAISSQAKADLARARRVSGLYERYVTTVTTKRVSILASRLIDYIFRQQAITIVQAARVLDLSYNAAKKHVENLEDLGMLRGQDDVERGKLYFAEEIMDAIRGDGPDEPSSREDL